MTFSRGFRRIVLAALRPAQATESELIAFTLMLGWVGIGTSLTGAHFHQQTVTGAGLVITIGACMLRVALRVRKKAVL